MQLLILEEVGNELCTLVPLVELGVGQLCWPQCRADELKLVALVLRGQQQVPRWVVDDLKLPFILEDVLQDQLLLRGVLQVRPRWV